MIFSSTASAGDIARRSDAAGGRYEEMTTAARLPAGEEIEDGCFRKTEKNRNYCL
jgi:hypothetical protein